MEMVNYVMLFDEPDPIILSRSCGRTCLLKAGIGPLRRSSARTCEEAGGKVVVVPYLKGFSTTEIIEKIKNYYGEGLFDMRQRSLGWQQRQSRQQQD